MTYGWWYLLLMMIVPTSIAAAGMLGQSIAAYLLLSSMPTVVAIATNAPTTDGWSSMIMMCTQDPWW